MDYFQCQIPVDIEKAVNCQERLESRGSERCKQEACDPSLNWDSVGEIVKEIDEQGAASRNGFTYSRTKNGGYTLLQASIITTVAAPTETKTPLDHDTVNKELDQVRERLKYIGQTAQYVKKAIPSAIEDGVDLHEKVTFLGIDGEFPYR